MNKIAIFVHDLEKMVFFYKDVMEMQTDWDGESKNVELFSDSMELIFYPRQDFEKMISTKLNYPKKFNGTFSLCFNVDTFREVDRKFASLVQLGAKPVFPPTTEEWGQRTSYISDPEGNLIELSSFNKISDTYDTKRLHMRPFTLSDADSVFEYASDEDTVKYLSWSVHKNIEDTKYILKHILIHEGCYAITSKKTKKLMGCIDIRFVKINRVTFGYVLNKKFWNKGYTSEALMGLIDYLFTDLKIEEIEGFFESENLASARVMEKCGMKWSHHVKDELYCGKAADCDHYIIYRDDYLKK